MAGIFAAIAGFTFLSDAVTVYQEISAVLIFVIAAVLFTGGAIVGAIEDLKDSKMEK